MNKTEKSESISQIKELASGSSAVFLVDYKGLTVADINDLRKQFKQEGVTYKVFKNTLVKRALGELDAYSEFNPLLEGMTGLAFAGENFVAPAKIIKKFYDAKKTFSLKGCYIDSEFFSGDKLDAIASMPTKDEIMSGIVGAVQYPAQGIVGAINAVMRDLVSVIDEISKKEAA